MKKKMSFRHALSVHFRAAKALHGVSRRFFPAATLYTVVGAILPYVTVFFSAQILKELALLRRPDVLRNWVIAGVLCTGLCAVAKAVLFQRTETMLDDLYGRKETLFCRKFFSMDYADVDKQETRDLRAQIAQNENWSSFGLMQVPEIYERTLKSLIGILSGIALTVTLFTSPVPESAGKLTALNNPLFILILAGVMILISILAGRLEEKSTSYWSCVAEEATLSNRVFSFFGFIGEHKGRGADIRMYNQQNLVTFYWNGDSAFGATGKIGKLALGPIGGYSALGTGVVALITGFVYVFTCLKAWGGAFDVGSVTQYVGAATAMADSIFKLTAQLGNLKTNAGYLDATFRFLDIPNSMYQGSLTTEKRSDRQYEVEFRNVSFRYPGREAAGSDQGVGAHKDGGFVTVLLQDTTPGLRIRTEEGVWIEAPPVPGTFIINSGELLELATNGFVRADVHDVVTPPAGIERYSVAFFLGARYDATIPVIALPEELKRAERGVTVDPLNPIFREVGINHLKSRLRSHPDVAAAHHQDLLHLLEKPAKA